MTTLVLIMGAFALLFVVGGLVRLRTGCSGDDSCSRCGAGECPLNRKTRETDDARA